MEQTIQRHGFITFSCWLGIIFSCIAPIISVIHYESLKNLGEYGMQLLVSGVDKFYIYQFHDEMTYYVFALQAIAIISAILIIVGLAKILKAQKVGFTIMACASISQVLLSTGIQIKVRECYLELISVGYSLGVYTSFDIYPVLTLVVTILSALIGLLAFWGILHIKKNDIPYWDVLK